MQVIHRYPNPASFDIFALDFIGSDSIRVLHPTGPGFIVYDVGVFSDSPCGKVQCQGSFREFESTIDFFPLNSGMVPEAVNKDNRLRKQILLA